MSMVRATSRKGRYLAIITAIAMFFAIFGMVGAAPQSEAFAASDPEDSALVFDDEYYNAMTVTIDGQKLMVKKYEVLYVADPVLAAAPAMGPPSATPPAAPTPSDDYQRMVIYVPKNATNSVSSAIQLNVGNAGWMSTAVPRTNIQDNVTYDSATNQRAAALKAGYVVVDIGTRSRNVLVDADGNFNGHAPACVVDSKAAIRYLRLNDNIMAGSAERIFITGTSGGGALTSAVAASGNSSDYYPYLKAIGAAGIDENGGSTLRDDVFAAIAYCPITDLGNADAAYEWQYQNHRGLEGSGKPSIVSQAVLDASAEIAATYPAYIASLGLKNEKGEALTAEKLKEGIVAQVTREVEEAAAEGAEVPALGEDFPGVAAAANPNDWLDFNKTTGKVVSVDYEGYLNFVARCQTLKSAAAFDNVATPIQVQQNETNLFGTADVEYRNFTEWAWNNNNVPGDGSGADDTGLTWAAYMNTDSGKALAQQIKTVNPLAYLGTDADSAPYWYVRHGLRDRDTSFAVEVLLYYGLLNDESVKGLNFELAWLQGHSGNYDNPEAYAWFADILKKANAPSANVAVDLSKAKITAVDKVWTGKKIATGFTLSVGGKNLTLGKDYTITATGANTSVGQGTVSIKGIGNYAGAAKATFRILPKAVKAKAVKVGKGSLTAGWTKAPSAEKVTKYYVRWKVKGAKSWSSSKAVSATKAALTVKNLKKGKKYEVQVRACKTVKVSGKNVNYYSAWSATKTSAKVK
jgi:hypothetical protein